MKEKSQTGARLPGSVSAEEARDLDRTVFDPGAQPPHADAAILDVSAEPTQHGSDTLVPEPTVMDLGSWTPAGDPTSPAHVRPGQPLADARAAMPASPPTVAPNDPKRAIRAKPAAAHIALPVGFRLHEYRIDGVLGQGGFGIAYKATDVNLNAKVVIKEYLPEDFAYRTTDSSVCARDDHDQGFYQTGLDSFLVEARTLATFRHPNIVRVARFFEANRTAYMVLEYERGQSLKAWRKKHEHVPEAELVALLAPLFNGLAVVHKSGYLHRDIKPDNIYVRDEDGSLVLLDFGAARQTASQSTEVGTVVTPGYAALEQYAGGGRQGPWTDIYAMGATLFWLVTGKKPFEAPARLDNPDPQPSAQLLGQGKYSEPFLRAIDWALRMHPNDRPQDIEQFRGMLFAAHAGALGLHAALNLDEDEDAGPLSWHAALASPRLLKNRVVRLARGVMRPADWAIGVKMALAMVVTALTPMLITAYYNHTSSVEQLSAAELQNLELLAGSTAGRVSQLLADSAALAAFLSTDDEFVALLNSPTEEKKRQILRVLQNVLKANPDVQVATVLDATGLALASSHPSVPGINFKFREYFIEAMRGRPFVTGIIIGATAGEPGVFFANPVRDAAGKVIGVVTLRIKGQAIASILEASRGEAARVPMLIDGDGIIIHHPDAKNLYKSLVPLSRKTLDEIVADQRFRRKTIETVNMPELASRVVNAKSQGHVQFLSKLSHKEEIAGYAPVPGHDWVVAMTEPREMFEEPLQRLFRKVLFSVALVGLVFMLLTAQFARRIVRPIQDLTSSAHALKSGDYTKATVRVTSNDEIGQLARVFNVMIDVLRQREREKGSREGK
jgi:serine/threonine protein kinase/HAMP domain-containing protein